MKKLVMKWLVRLHVLVYQITGGKFGARAMGFDILLLSSTGRKTGRVHTVPLAYIKERSEYAVVGSAGGSPRPPAWFLNVGANQKVNVQLGSKVYLVAVRIAKNEERERWWQKFLELSPRFGEYAKSANRVIPVVVFRLNNK